MGLRDKEEAWIIDSFLHTAWQTVKAERRFHKRLHLLHHSLDENKYPTPPEEEQAFEQTRRKKSRASHPKSRIYTLRDPEARIGRKSKTVMICGYKVQVLMSEDGTILETSVIPVDRT
ncbi:hypothetical protein [Paenibacillus daejeonensis]|uniref:hypothetical protein n=1 Tax=Paenibacillus daejeonensis TaxID=135193 RepID=UPI00035D6AC4|nr:hypothetical protein [Paenibacillus daejeonensis]